VKNFYRGQFAAKAICETFCETSALSILDFVVDDLGWHALEYSKGVVNHTPITPFEYSGTCHPTPKSSVDRVLGREAERVIPSPSLDPPGGRCK